MTILTVWAAGAPVAYTFIAAVQRAILDGPAYKARREHIATCGVCEQPNWDWSRGYTCGLNNSRARLNSYPRSLSPWFRLYAAAFWPLALVLFGMERAMRLPADWLAARIVARDAERVERIKAAEEVDRIIRESLSGPA